MPVPARAAHFAGGRGSYEQASELLRQAVNRLRLEGGGGYRGYRRGMYLRFFVFSQGSWFDVPSDLDWRELSLALYGDITGPDAPALSAVNPFLIPNEPEFLEVADIPSGALRQVELTALEARLIGVERRLQEVAATISGQESRKKHQEDEPRAKKETPNRERSEKHDVKSAVVGLETIASAVQSYPIVNTLTWQSIAADYPGVELFAIDADARSFEISKEGSFDGRANILISAPRKLRSGRSSSWSITIPARVYGHLSPNGDIKISKFQI
jgi:hypothetical protein